MCDILNHIHSMFLCTLYPCRARNFTMVELGVGVREWDKRIQKKKQKHRFRDA